MPRVEFGSAAVTGFLIREWVFSRPVFGPACVCCGADASGATEDYNCGTAKIRAPLVPMPVCAACRKHALPQWTREGLLGLALVVALVTTILGAWYLLWPVIVPAGVATIALLSLGIRDHLHLRALRRAGHHPRLTFGVIGDAVRLHTTNIALADDLLARNPAARRLATGSPASAADADRDARAELVAQKILSGKPADLDAVRALLAQGTISDVLVEGHLADVEQTLGRSDLRARYRAVRAEPGSS